jgi:hypothetical protein
MCHFARLLTVMLMLLALAACAPAAPTALPTPEAGGGSPTEQPTVVSASSVVFGTVTLSNAPDVSIGVQSVTALAIEGILSITAPLDNGAILSFALAVEQLAPGTVTLTLPGDSPATAGYTTAATAYVSNAGSITFTQTTVGFSAQFTFEASIALSNATEPPAFTVSGTITDIRVADQTG